MTLFDFEELTKYWTDHPPLHILVGAYLGVGKHRRAMVSGLAKSLDAAGSNFDTVLSELGPGFSSGDVHTGLAPVVLDIGELRRKAGSD
jgi:hypothetical protein